MSRRLENSLKWFFYEPRHFWLGASVCVAAIVLVVRQGGAEPVVRLVGLVLQLFGIVTIAWGIVETRQFFGMQSPLKTFTNWLSRFPLRRRTIACTVGEAVEADDALSARAHTAWPIDSSAPLEQRVSTLERNVPLIQGRISNLQAEFDRTTQSLKDQLKFEEEHRFALSQQLHSQLRTYGTGGLHISAIGAIWLFLGAVFGTASVELSALLK